MEAQLMQRLDFALDLKALNEDGAFEGYASVFGNRDGGGDIVEPGAFTKTLRERGAKGIKMLADHDPTKRVGVWDEMVEDEHGLKVRGRLLVEKAIGKEAHIDLKAGALDGLSIGYRVKSDAYDGRRRARLLKELDLFEISLVPFPMNEAARVTSVKSLTGGEIREIEDALRDAGRSQTERKRAVSVFKTWLRREDGEPETTPRDEAGAAELAELLRRNIATLS
jgi:HK97 family phage prohead protease